jgi:trehalose/maltose hydrolase-like predicted phosphorylase
MDYGLADDALRRTADFDLARTTHDSSLSSMACAGALARLDPEASWRFFEEALRPEHDPSAASKVAEGAHLGARAGAIDVLQRHYLGFGLRRDAILLNPAPPPPLGRVRIAVSCRFGHFACEWTGAVLRLHADVANRRAVSVRHPGGRTVLRPGRTLELPPRAVASGALPA